LPTAAKHRQVCIVVSMTYTNCECLKQEEEGIQRAPQLLFKNIVVYLISLY